MGRILARDCAFKMIYEYLFDKNEDYQNVFDEIKSVVEEDDKHFANDVFNKAVANFDELNGIISSNLKNMTISDLYTLDHAIILEALCELKYFDVPSSVVINEAVDLAKKYSTDNSPKFINAVLSCILKNINEDL